MLNIETVKEEYYRIEKLLGKEALSTTEYAAYCKEGYSAHYIKRDLGLSYNAMKGIIGAELATTRNKGPKLSKKKIRCGRYGNQLIRADECVPGCNDICLTCDDRQEGNISASLDTLTAEEEKLSRHGLKGAGFYDMIAPYAEI